MFSCSASEADSNPPLLDLTGDPDELSSVVENDSLIIEVGDPSLASTDYLVFAKLTYEEDENSYYLRGLPDIGEAVAFSLSVDLSAEQNLYESATDGYQLVNCEAICFLNIAISAMDIKNGNTDVSFYVEDSLTQLRYDFTLIVEFDSNRPLLPANPPFDAFIRVTQEAPMAEMLSLSVDKIYSGITFSEFNIPNATNFDTQGEVALEIDVPQDFDLTYSNDMAVETRENRTVITLEAPVEVGEKIVETAFMLIEKANNMNSHKYSLKINYAPAP